MRESSEICDDENSVILYVENLSLQMTNDWCNFRVVNKIFKLKKTSFNSATFSNFLISKLSLNRFKMFFHNRLKMSISLFGSLENKSVILKSILLTSKIIFCLIGKKPRYANLFKITSQWKPFLVTMPFVRNSHDQA